MKFHQSPVRPLATFAAGLLVLVACQNSTEPNANFNDPVVVSATFPVSATRIPDSTVWKSPDTSGSQKATCTGSTDVTCTETIHLPHPLGEDSLALELWTLGIRTGTIYFGQTGRSATLDWKTATILRDALDTLLLSKYAALTADQKASFSALGQGASSLVTYYATRLLAGDTAFVGKSAPVGMSADSVAKDLVYLAQKSGLTASQLLAKNLLPQLDSNLIRTFAAVLVQANLLPTSDTLNWFHPVRVNASASPAGTLTAGGGAVAVSGSFSWNAGVQVALSPLRVRTSQGVDTSNFQFSYQFNPGKTDTSWSLSSNLTVQASASAKIGWDTLVVTLSTDPTHSATVRVPFQVVSAPPSTPKIALLAPANQLGNTLPQASDSLFVSWGVSNWRDVNTDTASINGSKAAKLSDSTWGQNVYVIPNGQVSTITFRAVGRNGYAATSFVQVTRAKDTVPPDIIPGPSTVTRTVPFDTASVRLSWTLKDNFVVTSLVLNGTPLTLSVTPSQPADLLVGPNIFVLVATDTFWNTSRDSFVITRGPDITGPSLTWIAPTASISVDATVTSYKVQVKALDPSGVDSVYLQGIKANNDSGAYWSSMVSLPSPNGLPMKVLAKTWDKQKNLSVDSTTISITRNVPNGTDKPTLTILQPSSNVNNSLVYDSATLHVVYKITDLVPLDTTSIKFGTILPRKLTDSTWVADVPVPPTGTPYSIVVQVANRNGGGSSENVVVTRAKDAVPPIIAITSPGKDTTVAYGTRSITIATMASDAGSGLKSVVVKGTPVDGAGKAPVSLNPGVNIIVAIASDKAGNADTVNVTVTVMGLTAAPTFSPPAGIYLQAQAVTLSSAAPGADIYYTTDNSTPSLSSKHYSGPISVSTSDTIQAIAVASGSSPSIVVIAPYAIADTNTFGIPWNSSPSITYGALLDTRDNRVYRTVKIGSQTWMAQNLNYSGIGTTIGICAANSIDTCAEYGRLYTWTESVSGTASSNASPSGIQGICPTGWHVPSDTEWMSLQTYVDSTHSIDGTKLKSRHGWVPDGATSGNGADSYGFRALPGGVASNGTTEYLGIGGLYGTGGIWWTASDYSGAGSPASTRYMNVNPYVSRGYGPYGTEPNTPPQESSLRCLAN